MTIKEYLINEKVLKEFVKAPDNLRLLIIAPIASLISILLIILLTKNVIAALIGALSFLMILTFSISITAIKQYRRVKKIETEVKSYPLLRTQSLKKEFIIEANTYASK